MLIWPEWFSLLCLHSFPQHYRIFNCGTEDEFLITNYQLRLRLTYGWIQKPGGAPSGVLTSKLPILALTRSCTNFKDYFPALAITYSKLSFVSAIFIKFLFLHQMIALQKLWKMLFISSAFVLEIFNFLYFSLSLFFYLSAIALEDDQR